YLGDLLGLLPLALQLFDLGVLVDRHFEGESPLDAQAAQGELATRYILDELLGAAAGLDQPGGVLDALPASAGQREIRESLTQRGVRGAGRQHRAFGAAVGAGQDERDVSLRLPYDP